MVNKLEIIIQGDITVEYDTDSNHYEDHIESDIENVHTQPCTSAESDPSSVDLVRIFH